MKKQFWFSLVIVSVLSVVGLWSYGQAAGNEIEVCVKKNGAVFMIGDGFKLTDCLKNEKLISWNIIGPQGPKGDKGDQGLIGLTGPQGESNDSKIQELEARLAILEEMHKPSPGTLIVTNSVTGLVSTAYEGDSKDAILGFKVEAQGSDIAIQRVKLNLGVYSGVYNKFYKKLYLTDADGNVLASSDLNSSTIVKEGSNYYITLSGFNYVVAEGNDNAKQMYIKVDLYDSIDSTDIALHSPQTITLADNGVRGVDGVGIDQYSPTNGSDVTHSVTIAKSFIDASLAMSLNSSTPKKQDVVCTSGTTEDECDKFTVLVFDAKAEKDAVTITDMNIAVARSGSGTAIAQTAHLYEGSTALDSASIVGGVAQFIDLDYTILKDTTKTLAVKVDIRNANTTYASFIASASSTGITVENSSGDNVSVKSGTATGNAIGVLSVGPEFTLVSKSIATSGVPEGSGVDLSTSTLTATFNIKIKAVGGDIMFGISQATTSPFVSSTTSFAIYRGGSLDTTIGSNATSTSFTFPSSCSTSGLINSCRLAEGSEVTVPATFQIQGRKAIGEAFTFGLYSIGLARLNWIISGGISNTTFMAGETDWRTAEVNFP